MAHWEWEKFGTAVGFMAFTSKFLWTMTQRYKYWTLLLWPLASFAFVGYFA